VTHPKRPPPPDLRQIRKALLTAVASDDVLYDLLVLKGGNALELSHRIGERASLDLPMERATCAHPRARVFSVASGWERKQTRSTTK
jgi:hypothetical protein